MTYLFLGVGDDCILPRNGFVDSVDADIHEIRRRFLVFPPKGEGNVFNENAVVFALEHRKRLFVVHARRFGRLRVWRAG